MASKARRRAGEGGGGNNKKRRAEVEEKAEAEAAAAAAAVVKDQPNSGDSGESSSSEADRDEKMGGGDDGAGGSDAGAKSDSSSSVPSSSSDDDDDDDESTSASSGDGDAEMDDADGDDDDAVDAVVVGPDGKLPPQIQAMMDKAKAAAAAKAAASGGGQRKVQQPSISKSWAMKSCHAPCYTGGPVVACSLLAPLPPAKAFDGDTAGGGGEDEGDDDERPPQREVRSYLLTPCRGDLSLVDVERGVRVTSLRAGPALLNPDDDDEEEEDEENLDRDAVAAFAVSPDGRDLITSSRDSVLRVYNLQKVLDGRASIPPRKLIGKSGHSLPVTHIAFHPSSVFFATGSVDGVIKVWDLRGGYATHLFHPSMGRGTSSSVSCVGWHPDVSKLVVAAGRDDGTVCVHDMLADAASASGGKGKGKKKRWGMEDDKPIAVLGDHVSAVTAIAWAGDGNSMFLSAGRDAVINLWNVEEKCDKSSSSSGAQSKKKREKGGKGVDDGPPAVTYRRVHTLPVYEQIESLVLLNSTSYLCGSAETSASKLTRRDVLFATAGSGGKVRAWASRRTTSSPDGSHGAKYGALERLAEQTSASMAGEERGGYTGLVLSGAAAGPASVGAEGAGQLVAIDAERNLSLLTPLPPKAHKEWEGTSSSSDEEAAADAGGKGKSIKLGTDRTIVGHNDEILDLRILPSSSSSGGRERRIAVATNSPTVRIFSSCADSFSAKSALIGHADTVLALDVSPCGRFVLTAGKDRTARLWSTSASATPGKTGGGGVAVGGECLAIMEGHTESVGAACLSRKVGRYDVAGRAALKGEGAFAITGGRDKTIKKWALPGANELLTRPSGEGSDKDGPRKVKAVLSVKAHDKDINVAASSPTDSLVATGSQDKTIKLWSSSDLSPRGTLSGHKRGVWDVRFSPVDRVLASASGDRTVKLWSLAELRCVRTFQGHAESVLRVRFLSGGMQLVSGGADGLIKVWTVRNNECECTCDGHGDKVWALDVSEDGGGGGAEDASADDDNAPGGGGRTFISGGADSRLVVWRDTTSEIQAAKRLEEEKSILMEQTLANHLRNKEFGKALEVALELDKPLGALRVLESMIECELKKGKGGSPLNALRKHVLSWVNHEGSPPSSSSLEGSSKLARMLRYCRDWNTRARNSSIATLVVRAVVSSVPVPTLADAEGGALPEVLAGVVPYAERHFDRLDRMYGETYLIDHCLTGMGCLDAPMGMDGADGEGQGEYDRWSAKSKPVLPPTSADGRVQVGGMDMVGLSAADTKKKRRAGFDSDDSSDSEDEGDDDSDVVTIGDSDTESESEHGAGGSDSEGDGSSGERD